MKCIKMMIAMVFGACGSPVVAQSVDQDWLRQAGISCGGGLTLEVQGEIDAAMARKLKVATVSGEGSYRQEDVRAFLESFNEESQAPMYRQYVGCLLELMKTANEVTGLPPREIRLTSPISIATLEIVGRGDMFIMMPGQTRAIRDYSQIMSLDAINAYAGKKLIVYTISNSQEGKHWSDRKYQAETINLAEECTLVPYQVDVDQQQAAFISNC